jgi:hypothetical protein
LAPGGPARRFDGVIRAPTAGVAIAIISLIAARALVSCFAEALEPAAE